MEQPMKKFLVVMWHIPIRTAHTTTLTHKHVVVLYTNIFIYFAVPRSTFSSVLTGQNNRNRRSFFAVGRSNELNMQFGSNAWLEPIILFY